MTKSAGRETKSGSISWQKPYWLSGSLWRGRRRYRRPSYCFHTAYAKYANRTEVNAAMARGEVP